MKIGIDFGTSYSLPVAIINDLACTLLPNGEYGIPSVFYYDRECGVCVGKIAEDESACNPANVKRDVKMEISNSSKQSFVADGRSFTNKEIVAYIFEEIAKQAKREAERRQLESQVIDGAVISVPAAFTMRELEFIREAAKDKAKLNVLGFIREPVAAAIAYFNAPSAEDNKTILVYDLGGGTCDVALVRADKNANGWYKVLDSRMARIGGRAWTKELMKLAKAKLDVSSLDLEEEEMLYRAADEAKYRLSEMPMARISIRVGGRKRSCSITLEEFEQATSGLLNSTMEIVDYVVDKGDASIDSIVCVGGSSNMPQVSRALKAKYPHIEVKIFEPEKAIAFGAARYAENINQESYLRDICKFSYGIRAVEDFKKYHDENRLRIYNIVYKDSQLPADASHGFSPLRDDCDSLFFAIYESECTDYSYLPEEGEYIGDLTLQLAPETKNTDNCTINVSIDRSGLMVVKANQDGTNRVASVELKLKDF